MDDRELEIAEILASMIYTPEEGYTWPVYTATVRGMTFKFWGASNLRSRPELRNAIDGWSVRPTGSGPDNIQGRLYETLRDRQHRFDSSEELIRAILELLDEIEQ